ncbi:GNAT family N-acetyltransferase [Tychonema sp. LEGE 07199]|uniref:GNAT family N-acetyltransferase n=1 Tax=unclassified Tychonema TaxID=2642144 RepID=UPI001881C182|nr:MULTISPECIES: GNAT family N-acetyltransferase [unclassified Tychonema]MBE9123766.1 GNAT family N-acetyltransferase [Tychonema sp. LEGE 07199]MBE9133302.1 GNAT family N-acetyltransferase [Tychonema sp. LEGE 07196]
MIVREAKIADAPAIARVNLDTWRTAYRKFLPADYLAQLSYQKREKNWQEILSNVKNTGDFVCVAENDSGQIVGFAAGGCERTGKYAYQGELFAIYILEEYQRQGIGQQLVRAVVTKLTESSLNSMLAWVLGDNSACKFYEFLGGEKVDEHQTNKAGVAVKEIAYGWNDLALLKDRLA